MKAVILAGGSGTRLWPLSTPARPKQFLPLFGEQSLLQMTAARLSKLMKPEDIFVVAPGEYTHIISEQLSDLFKIPFSNTITEPVPRNTAPAIALAIAFLRDEKQIALNEPILVCPADHYINPVERFVALVAEAAKHYHEHIITFGIEPIRPETGYGYLELSGATSGDLYKVSSFIEKPDADTAALFVSSGRHCWNAGIFMFSIATILLEFEKHVPDVHRFITHNSYTECLSRFSVQESVSIDYAVMEKSTRILCKRLDVDWSDIGSWDAFYHLFPKDEHGNVVTGKIVSIDSQNSLVLGQSKPIALCGLKDIIVIETEDALLLCDRARSQEVKKIAKTITSQFGQKDAC